MPEANKVPDLNYDADHEDNFTPDTDTKKRKSDNISSFAGTDLSLFVNRLNQSSSLRVQETKKPREGELPMFKA